MELPPGPLYLLRLLLGILPTTIASYGLLRLLAFYREMAQPTWLSIVIVLSIKPIVMVYWRQYRNRVEAAANGAVLAPQVQGGSISVIQALEKSMKSGYPVDVLSEWGEHYGNIYSFKLVSEVFVITFEPEHIKAMINTQFAMFDKGPVVNYLLQSLLGKGLLNSDGEMWKFHRTMTRPSFSKERVTNFDIFDRHANDAVEQSAARLAAGYPIDFHDMVSRFTLDSATEFLFGHDVCTLSAGLPYPGSSPGANSYDFMTHPSNKLAGALASSQTLTALRLRRGAIWPFMEFWGDKVKPHRKIIDEFIEPILVDALAKYAVTDSKPNTERENTNNDRQPLSTQLLGQIQDKQVLKDELVNLLVAGRDTTASALTFAAYILTQHPHIVQRLRGEILDKVGHGDLLPTSEHIKEMKYLRSFINETLRLYPVVPFGERCSTTSVLLPPTTQGGKPFYIPARTRVQFSVFVMHRRTDLWGPDAHEFDPDRFIDERLQEYLVPNPSIFLPFGMGPRSCLGQQFAYHEISFFLIRLLQKFSVFKFAEDVQPADSRPPAEWSKCKGTQGTDKIWPELHLTMHVKGGLWVRMEEAHQDD